MTMPWSCEYGRVWLGYGRGLCFKLANLKTVSHNHYGTVSHGPVRFTQSSLVFQHLCDLVLLFLLFLLPRRGQNAEEMTAMQMCPTWDSSNKQMTEGSYKMP